MADADNMPSFDELDPSAKKAQLKAEQKKFKEEEKAARKEAKKKKKEFDERADDIEEEDTLSGGGFATFLITLLIILMWLVIMAILVKLDVGGFGSSILKPILKDIPYINMILPEDEEEIISTVSGDDQVSDNSGNSAADSEYVQKLELQLADAQDKNADYEERIAQLEAEVARLQPFEQEQSDLDEERMEFYNDIVYNDNAPDPDAYASYYEMIEPDAAAAIYQSVLENQIADEEVETYAKAYSSMKPKQAAAIFDNMDNLTLVARILLQMNADDRGAILGQMDEDVADEVTKLMEPENLPQLSNGSTR